MDQNGDELRKAWERTIDSVVVQAVTKDWNEYPPEVQKIIEAEAQKRGLAAKISFMKGEQNKEQVLNVAGVDNFACEGCKGTQLNFETGRCASCELPSDYIGYCIHCDKFWSLRPGQMCPTHGTKLSRHKAAMAWLRFGNSILDAVIFKAFAYVAVFTFVVVLVFFGLAKPKSFENISPLTDWLFSISLWYFYDFIFEAIWQRSPAKFITGTKVVTSDGAKPSVGTIAKRALIRFVPFDGLSFLGERVYGWHDRWSGTYVIKAKRFEKKKIDHNQVVICPQPISVVKTPEKSVEVLSVSHRKVEVCENCGRTIGKLEQAYVFLNHIVCQQCHEKLKKQI